MAITRVGFVGPSTAYGTFDPKEEAAVASTGSLLLMGAGCWLLFILWT